MKLNDMKRLSSRFYYPPSTDEMIILGAITICQVKVERGNYDEIDKTDRKRLRALTHIRSNEMRLILIDLSISYWEADRIPKATLVVERRHEA